MKGWMIRFVMVGLALSTLFGVAQAQYRPPPYREEKAPSSGEEDFEEAVDLRRFRRGNFEWDTQELIRSGFLALHREHEEILKELKELKARVAQVEQKQ